MIFLIAESEEKNALTTYFSYGSALIILRGLNALKTLIDLITYMLDDPSVTSLKNISTIKSDKEVVTIKRSSLLHPELQNGFIWIN